MKVHRGKLLKLFTWSSYLVDLNIESQWLQQKKEVDSLTIYFKRTGLKGIEKLTILHITADVSAVYIALLHILWLSQRFGKKIIMKVYRTCLCCIINVKLRVIVLFLKTYVKLLIWAESIQFYKLLKHPIRFALCTWSSKTSCLHVYVCNCVMV